jgi:hypothetical protein
LFDPLTFRMEANTLTIKPPHLLWKYITLHSIYQIFHFKHYKNINIENSHFIEICSNEMIRVFFFLNSIIYIITFISFWKFKIIWTKKKVWISLFNNISMTIFWKKKFNKWILFVNIIIPPMLNHFQLLYDYFSLI